MIRITQSCKCPGWLLIVEGTLSGVWVVELEKCWQGRKLPPAGELAIVDLSGVSYIDDVGRQLLGRMVREGAELRATGVMTKGIIDEIVARDSLSGKI